MGGRGAGGGGKGGGGGGGGGVGKELQKEYTANANSIRTLVADRRGARSGTRRWNALTDKIDKLQRRTNILKKRAAEAGIKLER